MLQPDAGPTVGGNRQSRSHLCHPEGSDNAEAYARTAKAAAERLEVMTQQLRQARQSGQARDIYHYVAHSGRQPNQQRGMDMA